MIGKDGYLRHNDYNLTPAVHINNTFYYNSYTGSNPAIHVASRDGGYRIYCDDDEGYSWGSSVNNHDFAVHNVIMDNRIIKRSVSDMIKQSDGPNILRGNASVSESFKRKSNCYLDHQEKVLRHEQSFLRRTNSSCYRVTCLDGIVNEKIVSCPVRSACAQIPSSGSCSYDVGLYRDGQRGGVSAFYRYDKNCKFSVRVKASRNGADSGLVSGNKVEIAGDRGYRYSAFVDETGLKVISSGGQEVCKIRF